MNLTLRIVRFWLNLPVPRVFFSSEISLDTVRIKGSVDIGDIEQVSEGGSAEQVVGRNLGVGGDFKMGNITQKIQRNQ